MLKSGLLLAPSAIAASLPAYAERFGRPPGNIVLLDSKTSGQSGEQIAREVRGTEWVASVLVAGR